jgi:hypothetical protein
MTSGASEILTALLKPAVVNNCEHFVFELDLSKLSKIVQEHKKFEFGK